MLVLSFFLSPHSFVFGFLRFCVHEVQPPIFPSRKPSFKETSFLVRVRLHMFKPPTPMRKFTPECWKIGYMGTRQSWLRQRWKGREKTINCTFSNMIRAWFLTCSCWGYQHFIYSPTWSIYF